MYTKTGRLNQREVGVGRETERKRRGRETLIPEHRVTAH